MASSSRKKKRLALRGRNQGKKSDPSSVKIFGKGENDVPSDPSEQCLATTSTGEKCMARGRGLEDIRIQCTCTSP